MESAAKTTYSDSRSGDFIRWHGALARKRREIRANRKGSAAENIYRGSVVLRYLFGRRTFGGMMR